MNHPSGERSESQSTAAGEPSSMKQGHSCGQDVYAVFAWGRNEDGQLGTGDTNDQDEPVYVDALRGVGVRQISCGSGHTVILTHDNKVYSWGRGDDGRLGMSDSGWRYVPRLVVSLASHVVTKICCGSYHTAAVTQNGELYTWGGGMYGKLGHGNEAGHSTPKRVDALVGIVVAKIACGSRHTAIVTNAGRLYSWGDKENGVAGHGDLEREGHQYVPRAVERLAGKEVIEISACGFHTAVITSDNELWTWGEAKFGRLGHGSERNVYSPTIVEAMQGKRPRQVACGGFHTACVTQDGRLYTFGGGEHSQLGHNDRVNKLRPTLVEALNGIFVSQVTCGWSHSVALTSSGRVYTWGNPDHGKLGLGAGGKVSVPCLVEKLKEFRVVRVASYNEHTAALVEPFDNNTAHSVTVSATYASDIRSLVNDDEFADVEFIVENQSIYAHRAILAQRCEHFGNMFRSGMKESLEGKIRIPDVSKTVFLLLLEYLYTDTVERLEVEHAIELYMLADLYRLEALRDVCKTMVKRYLSVENSGPLLQEAIDVHCTVLKEIILKFIVDNFDVVSKTEGIKQVSHSTLLEILSQR